MYPVLEGNLSWQGGELDPKLPMALSTMIKRTVALGNKLIELACMAGDFAAVVFAQVFVEETVNLFNLMRFVKPDAVDDLRSCSEFMEKAKKLPYLESCVEYPTDVVNAKPLNRF